MTPPPPPSRRTCQAEPVSSTAGCPFRSYPGWLSRRDSPRSATSGPRADYSPAQGAARGRTRHRRPIPQPPEPSRPGRHPAPGRHRGRKTTVRDCSGVRLQRLPAPPLRRAHLRKRPLNLQDRSDIRRHQASPGPRPPEGIWEPGKALGVISQGKATHIPKCSTTSAIDLGRLPSDPDWSQASVT